MVPFTAFLIFLSAQGDPLAEVPKLIERLHSPDFQERQEASRLLKEIGPPALALLEQAIKGKDAEVMTRSRDLVRQIRLRLALGPRLLREFPGIDDRLDTPKPRTWTVELFKILDDRWKDGSLKGLLPVDLDPLADRAFAGAQGDEEIIRLVHVSNELGLRAAFPPLRRLTESVAATTPWLAEDAMGAMTRVDPSNALPVLLGSLKPQNSMRLQILQLLKIRPGSVTVVEAVRPLLKDPDPSIRSEAAILLGTALDIPSTGAIEALLRDLGPQVRVAALIALQRLAVKRSSASVHLLLKDADEDVQRERSRLWQHWKPWKPPPRSMPWPEKQKTGGTKRPLPRPSDFLASGRPLLL